MIIDRRRLLATAAALALVPALPAHAANDVDPAEMLKTEGPTEIVMGSADAPVSIVEYHSMTCPHCANFHKTVLPVLEEKYLKTGKARLILRGFPLNELDLVAFMLLRCAPEEKYLEHVKLMYDTQRDWAYAQNPGEAVGKLAERMGFSQDGFKACLQNQQVFDGLVSVARRGAETFTVDSTPSFFINGTRQGSIGSVEDLETKLSPFVKN